MGNSGGGEEPHARSTKGALNSSTHYTSNPSGTQLALHYFSAHAGRSPKADLIPDDKDARVVARPVVLAHGTFSNHRSCRGLAQYLAKRGFDCWILDFQGHGMSHQPDSEPDFESMCLEDTQAALAYVSKRYPSQPFAGWATVEVVWPLFMYLARQLEPQVDISKLVTLASQATHAGLRTRNRLAIKLSDLLTRMLRIAPGRFFKIGPENEFAKVMLQWYRWSLNGKWLGADGFEYENALKNVNVPFLSLAAAGDTFIAPVEGCRHVFNCIGSEHKEFHYCGTNTGYRKITRMGESSVLVPRLKKSGH